MASSDFSKRLTTLLKERNMSIRQASKVAKVPVSTAHAWTAGAVPKDFVAIKRLAKELGVSLSYLLTGEQEESISLKELLVDGGELFSGLLDVRIRRVKLNNKGGGEL